MKAMTIVTPAFNRAHTLNRAYQSLVEQSNKNFVWLIIDDGSTDNTEEIVYSFIKEEKIEIKYIKKENGGKASALNMGLDLIDTPYCTCLDSDDWFPVKAIETALKLLNEEQNNPECCGVIGLKATGDGVFTGNGSIPQTYKYINIVEIYFDCKIESEFATFYKSTIAKEYRFPIIKGEKFMPPSWFHYAVGEQYRFRVSWELLCFFEYMDDGLTKNKSKVIIKNPKSYTLIKKMSLKNSKTIMQKVKNGIMYDCGCIIGKEKNWFKDSPRKGIALICIPLAYCVYIMRFKNKENL